MSAGTGTAFVASSGTSVTGRSVSSTAADRVRIDTDIPFDAVLGRDVVDRDVAGRVDRARHRVDARHVLEDVRMRLDEVGQVRPRAERNERDRLLGAGQGLGKDGDGV